MMWMFFHTRLADTVLFSWWKVETVGAMLLTCLVMFVGAFGFEAIKWLRLVLEQRSRAPGGQTQRNGNAPAHVATAAKYATFEVPAGRPAKNRPYTEALLSRAHFVQTALFAVQLVLSYLLMLAFMTFSVWIGLAICAGASLGFWLFGKRQPVPVAPSVGGPGTTGAELH